MLRGSDRQVYCDAILLHAVAVSSPSGAILLLGHTRAGKSTLSRLLAERFPTLIDDIICAARHRVNNRWYVTDAKLMHTGENPFVPMAAAVRTFQGPEAKLTRISPRELCKHLLDAIFETEISKTYSVERIKYCFAKTAEIARQYPGWRLSATLKPETPRLLWDCFS